MATIDLHDAHWFPVDLNVQEKLYAFLRLDEQILESSSFLDTRIEAALSDAVALPVDHATPLPITACVGWLFHTSFCGSTLLARILHAPPYNTCLREPLVLRRLGDARHANQQLDAVITPTIALLSRPWNSGASVVIKPTHATLNVAEDMMATTPGSRAVVMTSSLDDFLISNLKKPAESQAKIPMLAERAVQASGFHSRLPPTAFDPPDLLCAAVIQWAAQRELVTQIVEAIGPGRVRVLDMSALLEDLEGNATKVARWLQLDIPAAELLARCRREGSRNAKATESPYSAGQRAEDSRYLQNRYAPVLIRAREWAAQYVLPYMHPHALGTAPAWTST